MTDDTMPEVLPDEVERRFADLLAGPEQARAAAVEELCAEFEDLAPLIRARYHLAVELLRDIDAIGPQVRETTPDRIGPFRVLNRLGEGGMGTVYLAEQREPLQRRVAVKIIRAGMDSRRILARFELERQVLGRMGHPGIARVLDAGMTAEGLPWFAMEYVRGLPLSDYCDRNQLGLRERLELFRKICLAVQYAHHRGVIHRDLKPSNILVTDESGSAEPKIIDFGLARATDQGTGVHSVHTLHGHMVGTPAYMSPEQAEMSSLDVDTRTDIYSLGVVLYELLTGSPPVENSKLLEVGQAELQRRIREDDPPIPSSRASTPIGGAVAVAARRRTNARGLSHALRGDLDWITMKALEKDRARRYQTAQEFAADIERHLNDEAVLATPPTLRYRFGKLLRRYRVQAIAAALVLATGVGWLATSTWLYLRAETARGEAQEQAEQARQVTEFLVDLFDNARLGRSLGEDVPVRTVLDDGARRIRRELTDQPAVRARLLATIGAAYASLGFGERAASLYEDAIDAQRRSSGADDATVLAWELEHANALNMQGRLPEVETEVRRVLGRARELGMEELVARGTIRLGNTLRQLGRMDEAGEALTTGLRMYRELFDEGPELAYATERLAAFLHDAGRYREARARFEEALDLQERLFPNGDPQLVVTRSSLSRSLIALGELDRAGECIELAVADAERILGPDHGLLAAILVDYAFFLRKAGRDADAGPVLEHAVAVAETALGPEHPRLAWCLNDLGLLYVDQGRSADAQAAFARVVAVNRRAYPGGHLHAAIGLNNAAHAAARAGALDDAEAFARQALAMAERKGLGDEPIANSHRHLAFVFDLRGDGVEAERHARLALELLAGLYAGDHRWKAVALHLQGWAHAIQGRRDEAESSFGQSIAMYRRLYPDGNPDMAYPLTRLGTLLTDDDHIERALPMLEEALALRRSASSADNAELIDCVERLGAAYLRAGRFGDAEPLLLEALRARAPGGTGERAAGVRRRLTELYDRWGKPDEARRYDKQR